MTTLNIVELCERYVIHICTDFQISRLPSTSTDFYSWPLWAAASVQSGGLSALFEGTSAAVCLKAFLVIIIIIKILSQKKHLKRKKNAVYL